MDIWSSQMDQGLLLISKIMTESIRNLIQTIFIGEKLRIDKKMFTTLFKGHNIVKSAGKCINADLQNGFHTEFENWFT